jgi:hypothetical protein
MQCSRQLRRIMEKLLRDENDAESPANRMTKHKSGASLRPRRGPEDNSRRGLYLSRRRSKRRDRSDQTRRV